MNLAKRCRVCCVKWVDQVGLCRLIGLINSRTFAVAASAVPPIQNVVVTVVVVSVDVPLIT